jgi:hypothetical protein
MEQQKMQFLRKLATSAMIFAMLAQNAVNATTYYYRGNAGPAMQTASTPPDPNSNPSAFAILAQGPNYAVVGALYSATTYAYNNTGAVTFAITSGSLPSGMAINPQTGTISGTPTVSSSSTVTVVVAGTDSGTQNVATSSLSFDVINPFSISSNPGALVYVGTPYSVSFFLAGGSTPYTFSKTGLPAGLSFTPSGTSGLLNGAPTAPGTYNIIVTGQESHGLTAAFPYTLTVVADLALAGSPPTTGNVGTAYQGQFTTVGGVAPYTYRLLTGSLPTGLSLNANSGLISGNPLVAANKTGLSVQVTDADGAVATSNTFAINIGARLSSPLVISGIPSTSGKETFFYSAQYSATGGSGSGYSFSLTSGTLPNGITLSSAGLLSGTPVVGSAGTYSGLQVRVADGAGHTAFSPIFTLTIAPAPPPTLSIAGQALNPTFGASYTAQFTASGGMPAYTYSVSAGTLPPGLSLNATTGLISGSPNQLGTYSNITITAIDAASTIANTQPFDLIVIDSDPLSIAWSPTTSYQVGFPVVDPTTVTGGNASAYAFSITGALPPGLTQNSQTGALTGNFASIGTFGPLFITVTDGVRIASTTVATFSIAVGSPPPPPPPQDPLGIFGTPADAVYGQAYSVTFSGGGGAPPYSYAISGTLPAGLSFDAPSGTISGTPSQIGTFPNLQVTVTDSATNTAATPAFSIAVTDPNPLTITWSPQTSWQIDDFVASAPTVDGGDPNNYSFSIVGAVPPGLSLFSNGTLFGSLSQAGTFGPFQIEVSDGVRTAITQPAIFTVALPGLFASGFPAADANENQAYAAQFSAQGGSGSGYVFSINGTLPSGLTLDPNSGLISGTPAIGSAGTYADLSVHVVDDASNAADSTTFSIAVAALPALIVSGSPPTNGTLGGAYDTVFSAIGGTSSGYVFSLASGTLPPGLSLAADGTLSGIATAVGTYGGLQVMVTDDASETARSAVFSIQVVDESPLSVAWSPVTTWTVGTAFTATPTPAGGDAAHYSWSFSGTLPLGTSQDSSTGAIVGTLTSVGTFGPVAITVSDGLRSATTSPATFSVALPTLMISGTPSSSASLGQPYSAQFAATGGDTHYAFSLASGTLPPGLSISSSGLISGSPSVVGSYPGLSVMVADGSGDQTVSQAFSIAVTDASPLAISWTPQTSWHPGDAFVATPTASGGKAAFYSWSVSGGLPGGVSQDPATGALSGTLTTGGSYGPIAITVTDGIRTATTTSATFTVSATLAITGSPGQQAVSGEPYSATFSATGGGSGKTFSVASGALPTWLTLNASSGALSGTPGSSDTGTVGPLAIGVADAGGGSAASVPFSITVAAATATATLTSPASIRSGAAIAGTLASNLTAPAWSFASTPAGPALSGSGANFTGTAPVVAVPTAYSVTGTATKGAVSAVTPSFGLTVNPTFAVAGGPGSAITGEVGFPIATTPAVSYGVTAVGTPTLAVMNGGAAYDIAANCGLRLNANGSISGTPTAGCSASGLTIKATDSDGATASTSSFNIAVVGAPSAPTGTFTATTSNGAAYSSTALVTHGGTGPFTWTVVTGTPPTGLSLNATTGTLSGTATAIGSYTFTVKYTDANNAASPPSAPQTVVVTSTPTPTGSVIANATAGAAYSSSALVSGSGGLQPYTWSIASGFLPTGLAISPANGTISGTPTNVGTWTFSVKLTDALGNPGTPTGNFSVTVAGVQPPAMACGNQSITSFTNGIFSFDLPTVNVTPLVDYCWSYTFHGMFAEIFGMLTGAPLDFVMPATVTSPPSAAALSFTCSTPLFTASSVVNSGCNLSSAPIVTPAFLSQLSAGGYQYVVAYPEIDSGNGRALVLWNSSPRDLLPTHEGIARISGMAYQNQFPTRTYNFCNGLPCVPTGQTVTLSHDDAIGTWISEQSAQVQATTVRGYLQVPGGIDQQPTSFSVVLTDDWLRQTSTPAPTGTYASSAVAGTPYSSQISGSGTWSLQSGTLPAGLFINTATGVISGVATAIGTSTFTVSVSANGIASTASAVQTITVSPPTVTASLQSATIRVGQSFSGNLTSSLASPTWSLATSPTLATAVTGSTFSGTATTAGSYAITPTASVAGFSQSGSPALLTVKPAVSIAAPPAISTNAGVNFSATAPAVSNQIGALNFSLLQGGSPVAIGSVCPGLTFNAQTGVIGGTATHACTTMTFAIQVTDAYDVTTVTSPTFTVAIGNIVITPTTSALFTVTGSFPVPTYNTIKIRLWGGGGASSGLNSFGLTGTAVSGSSGGTTTLPALGLTAPGGSASNLFAGGAVCGAPSGGTTNTPGNPGGAGSPRFGFTSVRTFTGPAGGSAPGIGGGVGGAAVSVTPTVNFGSGQAGALGQNGAAPGGGASGAVQESGSGSSWGAISGGAGCSGSFVEKVFNAGDAEAPAPGTVLSFTVGAGGPHSTAVSQGGSVPILFGGDGAVGGVQYAVQ